MLRNSYSGVQQGGKLTLPSAENNDNDLVDKIVSVMEMFSLNLSDFVWKFLRGATFS